MGQNITQIREYNMCCYIYCAYTLLYIHCALDVFCEANKDDYYWINIWYFTINIIL